MRYYIYSAKLEEKALSVQEFMRKILLKYKIEKLCSSNIVSNRWCINVLLLLLVIVKCYSFLIEM